MDELPVPMRMACSVLGLSKEQLGQLNEDAVEDAWAHSFRLAHFDATVQDIPVDAQAIDWINRSKQILLAWLHERSQQMLDLSP